MPEQKFENGATVKLKSGGLRMTVSGAADHLCIDEER